MRLFSVFILSLHILPLPAQPKAINIVECTIKVGARSEEILYYGFAEGDRLVFSFHEANSREVQEVEIFEYPEMTRFREYKLRSVEKIIEVPRTGVYAFRLRNSGFLGRLCRIRIDRVPAGDGTKQFNPSVKWVLKPDTSWNAYTREVIAGYDTLLEHKTRKEMVKSQVSEDLFLIREERVHSQTNSNGNTTSVFFTVPTYSSTAMVKKRVVSLAYWIGVGDEANEQWNRNTTLLAGLTRGAARYFISPLGAYALGLVAYLSLPSIGEDVRYVLLDEQNKRLLFNGAAYHALDEGKGVAGYRKFTDPFLLDGRWYLVLENDNYLQGIDVSVKVSVMVQTDLYEEKPYTEQKIKPRYENRTFREPVIRFSKVLVNGD